MRHRLGLSILTLIALALCFITAGGQGSGYNSAQLTSFVVPGSGATIQQNSLMLYHKIIWTDVSVTTCTVTVDSSPDGVAWTTGGIITSQNCGANGSSAIVAATANYIRVTVATLTGAGANSAIQYQGWAYNPIGSTGTISPNNGSAGALATFAAAGGSTTVGPDAGLLSNGTGTLTLGAVGVGSGATSYKGTTSGSINLGCGNATCSSLSLSGALAANSNITLTGHLNQNAANQWAGSCAMAAATTCTFTIAQTFTNYLSFVSIDHVSTAPATANSAVCSISGTTVTVTAGISNSLTWDCLLIGNPN